MKIYSSRNISDADIIDRIVGKDTWIQLDPPNNAFKHTAVDQYFKVLSEEVETRADIGTTEKSYWVLRLLVPEHMLPLPKFHYLRAEPFRVSQWWLTSYIVKPVVYLTTDELVQMSEP